MADFTIELRDVVRKLGADHIGLSDYPIFDEQYREFLNSKILDHYWYNEIAHETVDMFVHQVRVKMAEIMPYYNKWYEAELVDIDPLSTQDAHSTGGSKSKSQGSSQQQGSTSNENDTSSTGQSVSRTVLSEYPQARLAGNKDYATAATENKTDNHGDQRVKGKADQSSRASQDSTGEASSESHSWGRSGHTAALIAAWRETFVNVDMMVISELEPLFMGLHSSNDSFTGGRMMGHGLWF